MAAAAAIEPREAYFQYMATKTKIANAANAAGAHNARKTPSAAATPFPPLKFNQTGKQWPINAARPAITIQVALSLEYRAASETAAKPLAASSTSVKIPAAGPATRATLVAPILRLPAWRMSTRPKILAINSPQGMEPSR